MRRLPLGLVLCYVVGYVLWRLALRTPLYSQIWQLPLSELFGSWLYLPLPLLAILALLVRSRWALILLLIPGCFFAAEYGRQFLPNWQTVWQPPPATAPLRILTWNTLYTTDREGELQALLHQLQPDIVALQELSYLLTRRLSQEMADDYPHQAVDMGGSTGGLALLSRYPLRLLDQPRGPISCQCLVAEAQVGDQRIRLIVVHIWRPELDARRVNGVPTVATFSDRYQTPIFNQLLAQIEQGAGPLVVMGDFNTTERQPNYRRLRTLLDDAFAQAGWGMGYTYPVNDSVRGIPLPRLIRIDHILVSPEWQARAAWTGSLPTSDHGYVVADLALRRE
jgi:vancomycin resistance protein VanJ